MARGKGSKGVKWYLCADCGMGRRSPVAGACPGCGSGTILDAPRGHARCAEPGCDEWAGKPDSSGTCATFCQPHCPDCQSEWFGKIPIVKLSREDLLKLYP